MTRITRECEIYFNEIEAIDSRPKNINQGTSPAIIKIPQYDQPVTHVLHFDYVDGCSWNEVDEYLPSVSYEHPTDHINVLHSGPCKVKLRDGRITTAVYAVADGDSADCKGWVEMFQKTPSNWHFVENIFSRETLDVVRWHFRIS